MADCECKNWCREGQMFVTTHHPRCSKYSPEDDAYKIIVGLLRGIEAWAQDEDGVHPECWEAYKTAKAAVWEAHLVRHESDGENKTLKTMMTESVTKGKGYRLELMIDEEGNNIRVVGGDSLPITQEGAEPCYPGWFILKRRMERPVICVGLETLAVLFQGGTVNLDGAVLIPDSNISNAARYALNERSPAMRDSQNIQFRDADRRSL